MLKDDFFKALVIFFGGFMALSAAQQYYQSRFNPNPYRYYKPKDKVKLLEARVDSLARQTAANERAFLTILARIETKGWEPVCVDGLLAAYDYERQRIINKPENNKGK